MSKSKTETNSGFLDFPLYAISENDASSQETRGEGKKGIIILAKADDIENQLAFMMAVLSPLSIKLEDIILINTTAKSGVSFASISRDYDLNALIVLGIPPTEIGLQVQAHIYQAFELSGKKILFTESTQAYIDEKEKGGGRPKAKQLWMSLKGLDL